EVDFFVRTMTSLSMRGGEIRAHRRRRRQRGICAERGRGQASEAAVAMVCGVDTAQLASGNGGILRQSAHLGFSTRRTLARGTRLSKGTATTRVCAVRGASLLPCRMRGDVVTAGYQVRPSRS